MNNTEKKGKVNYQPPYMLRGSISELIQKQSASTLKQVSRVLRPVFMRSLGSSLNAQQDHMFSWFRFHVPFSDSTKPI